MTIRLVASDLDGTLLGSDHVVAHRTVDAVNAHNDLSMLEWAGRAVAMGNAESEVKAIADEVTASHDDHGVALVLETLLA